MAHCIAIALPATRPARRGSAPWRPLAGLVLIGVMLLLPALAAAADPDPQLERDLVALTNADRTSNGVPSLLVDDRLLTVARERSDDMVTRGYFAHEIPPTGARVFEQLVARGVDYEFAAENIGFNNAPRQASVQHIQGEFLRSPAHRANLLREHWRFLGIGAVPGSDRILYTVLFMKPFPSDPAAARLAPAPPPPIGTVSQNAEPASAFEQAIDTVLGRNLGIPGMD